MRCRVSIWWLKWLSSVRARILSASLGLSLRAYINEIFWAARTEVGVFSYQTCAALSGWPHSQAVYSSTSPEAAANTAASSGPAQRMSLKTGEKNSGQARAKNRPKAGTYTRWAKYSSSATVVDSSSWAAKNHARPNIISGQRRAPASMAANKAPRPSTANRVVKGASSDVDARQPSL